MCELEVFVETLLCKLSVILYYDAAEVRSAILPLLYCYVFIYTCKEIRVQDAAKQQVGKCSQSKYQSAQVRHQIKTKTRPGTTKI